MTHAMEGELPALAPTLLKRMADASGTFLGTNHTAPCVGLFGLGKQSIRPSVNIYT